MTGRSPPCRSRGLRRWARDASRWKTLPHRPAGGDRKNAGPNAGLVERVLSARGLEVADERVQFRVGHRADVDMRREPRVRVARHRLLDLRGDLLGQGASRHRQLDVDDDVMGTAGQVVCIATGGIAGSSPVSVAETLPITAEEGASDVGMMVTLAIIPSCVTERPNPGSMT